MRNYYVFITENGFIDCGSIEDVANTDRIISTFDNFIDACEEAKRQVKLAKREAVSFYFDGHYFSSMTDFENYIYVESISNPEKYKLFNLYRDGKKDEVIKLISDKVLSGEANDDDFKRQVKILSDLPMFSKTLAEFK